MKPINGWQSSIKGTNIRHLKIKDSVRKKQQ